MRTETLFMIDIETTGVNRETDDILQVGCLMLDQGEDGYFNPRSEVFEFTLHTNRQPENAFAKKHMSELYKKCNETPEDKNLNTLSLALRTFIHGDLSVAVSWPHHTPKLFIGWNASNFDLPFLFDHKVLTPSYYVPKGDKEELAGDAHYRIYEQTGSVQLISDMTGLDRKTIEVLAMDLNPTNIKLPKGKEHDALYDCYKQTIMQNGLIKIGRMGIAR